MEMAFDAAFSGLTRQTSGGSPWCLSDLAGSKQEQGWSAGDEEREMEKKSNKRLSEEQPLEEKATESLSQLSWPWAAIPPGPARQSRGPTPVSHGAGDRHEVAQPCRPEATSSRRCSASSWGFLSTSKGSLSHSMLLTFPSFQKRAKSEP